MKKIEGLYRSYCHERELEMQEWVCETFSVK